MPAGGGRRRGCDVIEQRVGPGLATGRGFDRRATGRNLSNRGEGRRRDAERGDGQSLLLLQKALESSMGLLLTFEELAVEVGRLLAEALQGDEIILGRA